MSLCVCVCACARPRTHARTCVRARTHTHAHTCRRAHPQDRTSKTVGPCGRPVMPLFGTPEAAQSYDRCGGGSIIGCAALEPDACRVFAATPSHTHTIAKPAVLAAPTEWRLACCCRVRHALAKQKPRLELCSLARSDVPARPCAGAQRTVDFRVRPLVASSGVCRHGAVAAARYCSSAQTGWQMGRFRCTRM